MIKIFQQQYLKKGLESTKTPSKRSLLVYKNNGLKKCGAYKF